MTAVTQNQLLHYLQNEMAVSAAALQIALRHREQDPGPLPLILWKYGFITLEQLDRIYDWLETACL